ncbi:MAG: hypothetical protein PHQ23_17265 [Candidatus Wallbacteria bacterium]|nr:hypothetical protein [Candidatus Wallbacteria bacterium]
MRSFLPLIFFICLECLLPAADITATLDTSDGGSGFVFKDASNVEVGRITSLGAMILSGTAEISSGLVIDTNTLYVNGTTGRVGIGSTIPASKLDVEGTVEATAYLGDGRSLTGAGKVVRVITVVDTTRHNTSGGRTANRGLPSLTINKQFTSSKILLQWSMSLGLENSNCQIMWRVGSNSGTIVNVSGADYLHTNKAQACSTHAGTLVYTTASTGDISFFMTFGRGTSTDDSLNMIINPNSNESSYYQQSYSTFVISEVL